MVIKEDIVLEGKTRTRRTFCSYYTKSDPILDYMVSRLQVSPQDLILEPCAGDGIFIDKIKSLFPKLSYQIEALDLNPKAVDKLNKKFCEPNIKIRLADTLLDTTLDSYVNMNGNYTKIISNPPYGAWQDSCKRSILKRKYSGYVKETYTLFIQRAIDLLKEKGKLVFIVPDTFLALHLHKETRKKILQETKLEEILLIPSNFFPDVNFGYSNLCIITLTKGKVPISHKIKIIQVKSKVEDLHKVIDDEYPYLEKIKQKTIINSIDYSFFIGGNTKIRNLINNCSLKLGDIAECVTGFCSGNNTKFYKPINLNIKNTKNYKPIKKGEIENNYLSNPDLIEGLIEGKKYIPILKGGSSSFFKKTDWFVLWDKQTVDFYRTNKKSRFQNSKFYFKEGIGVPMVRSKKIKAFLLEKRLFDQSIVGIFPKDYKYLYYILAFLNSEVSNRILSVINHTTNNSANYLKKLPIIVDNGYFEEITNFTKQALLNNSCCKAKKEIDKIFREIYKIE